MTYAETIQFLYGLRMFGLKFGLENTLRLADSSGNPHRKLRFIHVAGTNGKGSTCAMLENIYRTAGFRVGLFTSPHLVSFRERIQVNRALIPEGDVVRLVAELRPRLAEFPSGHHPTFFEVVAVLALLWFVEQECELVIWETGMGGRLDATNIVTPMASVITMIDFDHQQWLGNTLEQIASEKAGIIKPGVPVLAAPQEPAALEVISHTAERLAAPLTVVGSLESAFPGGTSPRIGLMGDHQRANAALACCTVDRLQPRLPISPLHLRRGLETVDWPGRLQIVQLASGGRWLLDGAHNPASARVLRHAIKSHWPDAPATLILGMLADKDCREVCATFAPAARRILAVPVDSARTANARSVAAWCSEFNPSIIVESHERFDAALQAAQQDPFVIVTGSLYLVGQALEALGASPVAAGSERHLNEWSIRT